MKNLLVLSVALVLFGGATAQVRITGRTVNAADGKPAGWVTVSAERDSTAHAVVYADGEGRFTLSLKEAGTYDVHFSMVGYKPAVKRVEAAKDTDMGDVALEEGEMIDEVQVTIQKPLITHTAEKMTYEVDNDPQAATSTLEEIIRKVPQLTIDAEGNVKMNGESNYKILVNGHSSGVISRNFSDVIKSMPASQIKRIEVITNPSMKYDAEGTGGILNIITSGRRIDGFDGSLSYRQGFEAMQSSGGSARVALQTGKFAFDLNGYGGYFRSPMKNSVTTSEIENLVSDANRYQSSTGRGSFENAYYGVTMSASYQMNDRNLFTLEGGMNGNPLGRNKSVNETVISDVDRNPVQEYASVRNASFDYTGGSATISYEHRFDDEGSHTLSFSDNVDIAPDKSDSRITYTGDVAYEQIETADMDWIENTFQTDYSKRFGERHTLDLGLKHVHRGSSTTNGTTVDGVVTEAVDMDYTQDVAALYGGYNYNGAKWSANGGARLEATWNAADVKSSREGDYSFDNSFWNVVPYMSVGFNPSLGHSLSLTYTERLGRPSIWQLSPYETVTPTSISSGNADLKSEVSHTITLKYAFMHKKWNMSLMPTVAISNNGITYFSEMRDDGIRYSTITNDLRTRRAGMSAMLMFRPHEKFSMSVSMRGTWMRYSLESQGIDTEGWGFSESMNAEIKLWKGGTLSINESLFRSGVYLGSRNSQWNVYYGFYVTQKFLKDRLTLTVSGNNPFRGDMVYRSRGETPTYVSSNESRAKSESYSVGLSWRFGNKRADVKRVRKSISNDDSVAGGDGGGSSSGGGAAGAGGAR